MLILLVGRRSWRCRRIDLPPAPGAHTVRYHDAGWSSSVARWAHNPEVAGSNPAPATRKLQVRGLIAGNGGRALIFVAAGWQHDRQGRQRSRRAVTCPGQHLVGPELGRTRIPSRGWGPLLIGKWGQ